MDVASTQPPSGAPGSEDADTLPSTRALYHFPPPPNRTYASREDALDQSQAFANQHGYKLVRRKPHKSSATGMVYRYWLECSRHGKSPTKLTPETRRRNRISLRQGCPMRVILSATLPHEPDGTWEIRYTNRESIHNHSPATDPPPKPTKKRARKSDATGDPAIGNASPTDAMIQDTADGVVPSMDSQASQAQAALASLSSQVRAAENATVAAEDGPSIQEQLRELKQMILELMAQPPRVIYVQSRPSGVPQQVGPSSQPAPLEQSQQNSQIPAQQLLQMVQQQPQSSKHRPILPAQSTPQPQQIQPQQLQPSQQLQQPQQLQPPPQTQQQQPQMPLELQYRQAPPQNMVGPYPLQGISMPGYSVLTEADFRGQSSNR